MNLRTIALALPLSLVACAAAPDERHASSSSPVEATGAWQDWSLLEPGQCLASLQAFYRAKFGATVGYADDTWASDCGRDGACHIWLDDVPNKEEWERVAYGEGIPSPYDLLVYPPTATNEFGHVASVDHVDADGVVWVMDSNFKGDEQPSTSPHTVSRAPYGWYHLRALGTTTQSAPEPESTTLSCGQFAMTQDWPERATCEWNDNGACGGVGTRTSDCDHCCRR